MRLQNGFAISDHQDCTVLREAFSNAVAKERGGVYLGEYLKDGYFEHPLDAARYPAHSLTGGTYAQQFSPYTGTGEANYHILQSPY